MSENNKIRRNAKTKQKEKQTRIIWNDSNMRSVYANICNVTSTREETKLLFGMNQTGLSGRKEDSITPEALIILSPSTAKRLGMALNNVILHHESRYGSLELESPLQNRGSRIAAIGKKPSFPGLEKLNEKAGRLFQLIQNLNLEYGLERSFKMAEKKLLWNRFLLAIRKKEIKDEKLLEICKLINMPGRYLEAFKENLSDANIVFFGFEENEKNYVYKVYLEFWDKIKKEIRKKPNKTDPALLHLGFKWDSRDNDKGAVARYTCYPMLSVDKILKRLSNIYDGHNESPSFKIAKEIINLAASRAADDLFIYLEVNEENNPRRSFDINLYKAKLQLRELYPLLSKMCRHYSIPSGEFDLLFEQVGAKIFGHLSGGIDREGKDFLTTYYEIEGL